MSLRTGENFSINDPGRSPANAAFFILRNGDPARRFIADWWAGHGAERFHFVPWYEQVALGLIWKQMGSRVAVLRSNRTGWQWKHMGRASAPTLHIDSSMGRFRLPAMRGALLALTLRDAMEMSQRVDGAPSPCAGFGRVVSVSFPRNLSSDLRTGPSAPGDEADREWLSRSQIDLGDGKR